MLGELETVADRLSEWLQKNIVPVAGGILALLVAAGIGAWLVSSRQSAEQEASSALAQTRADYLSAMGAQPGAFDAPELANQAAAAQIREEYGKRYAEVETKHAGTVAGALAAIERAGLLSRAARATRRSRCSSTRSPKAPAKGGCARHRRAAARAALRGGGPLGRGRRPT
jgi:hypothetical protein